MYISLSTHNKGDSIMCTRLNMHCGQAKLSWLLDFCFKYFKIDAGGWVVLIITFGKYITETSNNEFLWNLKIHAIAITIIMVFSKLCGQKQKSNNKFSFVLCDKGTL